MPGARHKKVSHIIETQSQAEEAFLKELRSGSYTHEHPLIAHNLYGINPLSASSPFTRKRRRPSPSRFSENRRRETSPTPSRKPGNISSLSAASTPIMKTRWKSAYTRETPSP